MTPQAKLSVQEEIREYWRSLVQRQVRGTGGPDRHKEREPKPMPPLLTASVRPESQNG